MGRYSNMPDMKYRRPIFEYKEDFQDVPKCSICTIFNLTFKISRGYSQINVLFVRFSVARPSILHELQIDKLQNHLYNN